MAASGGLPSVICNEPGRDAAWSAENIILIGGQNKPLLRVSALGGQPTPATELGPGETTHDYPDFLPDGRHFLYLARAGADSGVFVGSLDSKERVPLPGIRSGTRYSPTGHVVFIRNGTLMAQPFDVNRLELTGDAFAVAEQVQGGLTASFSISENGSVAYLGETPGTEAQLGWFDKRGNRLSLAADKGRYENPELSPNGRMLAFDRDGDVFYTDLDRNVTTRVASHIAADFAPKWSPDSRTIAFASLRERNANPQDRNAGVLYEQAVGVVADAKLLLQKPDGHTVTDWSPDGRYLISVSAGDIWALPLPASSDSKLLRVTETSFNEIHARVSPNGRWIACAYASTESENRYAVYIQSFPERGASVPVGPGIAPRWSHDGRELFYIAPAPTTLAAVSAGTLMSVSVNAVGGELQVGTPDPLFQIVGGFNVSPDGRFLLNMASTDATSPPIRVIHNWAALLER